jgi:hypothetical protein
VAVVMVVVRADWQIGDEGGESPAEWCKQSYAVFGREFRRSATCRQNILNRE